MFDDAVGLINVCSMALFGRGSTLVRGDTLRTGGF